MRKSLRWVLVALVAVALTIGILGVVQADPGNGKGKGTFGRNCKKCPPKPEGCTFFECDNHFCNYSCVLPDGSTTSLNLPK